MSLQGALASLLLAGPAHGYALQARLEGELGPTWQVRTSHLYLTLGRMERQGLITAEAVRGTGRPDRRRLRLTASGRRLAARWLDEPGPASELAARVAIGRIARPAAFRELVDTILDERADALHALRSVRAQAAAGFAEEALTLEIRRAEADVRWLAAIRAKAAELATRSATVDARTTEEVRDTRAG